MISNFKPSAEIQETYHSLLDKRYQKSSHHRSSHDLVAVRYEAPALSKVDPAVSYYPGRFKTRENSCNENSIQKKDYVTLNPDPAPRSIETTNKEAYRSVDAINFEDKPELNRRQNYSFISNKAFAHKVNELGEALR